MSQHILPTPGDSLDDTELLLPREAGNVCSPHPQGLAHLLRSRIAILALM